MRKSPFISANSIVENKLNSGKIDAKDSKKKHKQKKTNFAAIAEVEDYAKTQTLLEQSYHNEYSLEKTLT